MSSGVSGQFIHLIDRQAARSIGLPQFLTGDACKNGHVAYRYVASGACVECRHTIRRASYLKRSGKSEGASKRRTNLSAAEKKCREAEQQRVRTKARRDREPEYAEKQRSRQRDWVTLNAGRAKETRTLWRERNPHYSRAGNLRRLFGPRASELDLFVIDEICRLAVDREKATGIKWHVDHVIPIMSPSACGLNCYSNLQLLPAVDNLRKGSRFAA